MKHLKIIFPENFTLIDKNIDETIFCLSKLIGKKKTCFVLDFSKIKTIRKSDLMILFAQIEKSFSIGNTFIRTGSFSDSKRISIMLKQLLKSTDKAFHHQAYNYTDFEKAKFLIPDEVTKYVKILWKIGIRENFASLNTFITEITGNAVEHGIRNKNINYWLDKDIDKKEAKVTYTFVDMGRGIIDSHKKARLPIKYYFLPDERIILDSFFGLLRSSTKLLNRGRGLPQLTEMIEKEWVSDFILISNTISLQYINGNFVTKKHSDFKGTYFSWTINKENFEKWKTSR